MTTEEKVLEFDLKDFQLVANMWVDRDLRRIRSKEKQLELLFLIGIYENAHQQVESDAYRGIGRIAYGYVALAVDDLYRLNRRQLVHYFQDLYSLKVNGADELLKQEADYWKQLDDFYKFQNKEFEDIQRLAEKLYDLLHWRKK